jgi:hypothetical protein
MAGDDVSGDDAFGALGVLEVADFFTEVEDDRTGEVVIASREIDERFTRFGLEIGGIDNSEAAPEQSLSHDVMDQVEGIAAGGLVVLVVADEGTAGVGGDDFGRAEVAAREGAFAAPRRADE